ncbi:Nin1 binding protein [Agyrium rufum]|nr:Nin1 binding protein [Agyrium rufum]
MPTHTIILDAGPLLSNSPSISSLLAKAEKIYTTPSIIAEIKDKDARARLQATVVPFIVIKSPSPNSVKAVTEFARRTGDLVVLSRPDLEILALAYELECERNGGDWRLRSIPGQKALNGKPPAKFDDALNPKGDDALKVESGEKEDVARAGEVRADHITHLPKLEHESNKDEAPDASTDGLAAATLDATSISHVPDTCPPSREGTSAEPIGATEEIDPSHHSDSSDSDGWITPSNLKKQQAKDSNGSSIPLQGEKDMQVATITSDFAMQNVLLQMNLNLLSPSLLRIRHLKTYILRCHACFMQTKDPTKQFCPRCGGPTLNRVSCSTSANGDFQIHLKQNMQWNTRGNRYSIPKPVAGTAKGLVANGKGGGKNGWGKDLILAEDQKEYLYAMRDAGRKKERNLMDDDYLPGILTGDRGKSGSRGRPKVGAGRNVNAKKRF